MSDAPATHEDRIRNLVNMAQSPVPAGDIAHVNGTEVDPLLIKGWPAPLAGDAYLGLAGDFVGTVTPSSEADPVALLVQFLVAFGSAVGRSPYFRAEADRHGMNLFAVIVGETAKGRKGTSWGHVRHVVSCADQSWSARVASGLSSGEGLIWAVRDKIEKMQPVKEKGKVVREELTIIDEGVTDKRLLAFEGEFASVLSVGGRDGSTLSPIVRNAWDTGELRILTKNSPAKATGAHISIVGHVTRDELNRHLTDTQAANGFGNRFLWICARRSKMLPEGGTPEPAALEELIGKTRAALKFANMVTEMRRDSPARDLWHLVYPELSEGKAGLLGCILARGEAQVMRLASLYALLDESDTIREQHLKAGLAVWRYAEASAKFIFGDKLGDATADAILGALRQTPDGLSKTEISELFSRNHLASAIDAALSMLADRGLAEQIEAPAPTGRGRRAKLWRAR